MRYASDRKEISRQKMLAAASRAIRAEGPTGISVASVMSEAGLTHGAFYHHFESKDELVASAVDFMIDGMFDQLNAWVREKAPNEALAAIIDNYLSIKHCASRETGCPISALGSDGPMLDIKAQSSMSRGVRERHQLIVELLQKINDPTPDVSAYSIQAELVGALINARLSPHHQREAMLEASRTALKKRYLAQ